MSVERDDELREVTLASERPFRGRLISVRVDRVRLPQGREAQREIVEHAPAVAAVPLLDDGQVVMVRQWRHPARQALLEIPAGLMDPGETPEECVNRELAEEVGLQAGRLERLSSLYLAPGYCEEVLHLYLARDLYPAQAEADEDENLHVVRLPLAEAVRRCRAGEIPDAKTVAGLLEVYLRLGPGEGG